MLETNGVRHLMARVVVVLLLVTSALVSAAVATPAEAGGVSDDSGQQQRFIGTYLVTMPRQRDVTMTLRVFKRGGTLFGQINNNEPTALILIGEGVFRPQAARGFSISFALDGAQSSRITIESPEGTMNGVRVESPSLPSESERVEQVSSGPLYEALLRADRALFEAAFVKCDLAGVQSFLAEDVEFYHDQTGARFGKQVLQDFEHLTANCPAKQRIKRELVAGSLQVFPMKGGYAIQMGAHRFVHAGETTGTVARFVHLWKLEGDVWRLVRVLSCDHRTAGVR